MTDHRVVLTGYWAISYKVAFAASECLQTTHQAAISTDGLCVTVRDVECFEASA